MLKDVDNNYNLALLKVPKAVRQRNWFEVYQSETPKSPVVGNRKRWPKRKFFYMTIKKCPSKEWAGEISLVEIYEIASSLAALSCSQYQVCSFSWPQRAKCWLKKLSVTVDTMKPVSNKQETSIPPIFTCKWGHEDTNLETLSKMPIIQFEPAKCDSVLHWLTLAGLLATLLRTMPKEIRTRSSTYLPHTPKQNYPAADIAYKPLATTGQNNHADSNSAREKCS